MMKNLWVVALLYLLCKTEWHKRFKSLKRMSYIMHSPTGTAPDLRVAHFQNLYLALF